MKLKWRLDFWKPENSKKSPLVKELEKEIRGNKQAMKHFLAMVETLEALGPSGFISSRNKSLGNGLYELRDIANGKRYYYAETGFKGISDGKDERIILLLGAVGSKNTATGQDRDIKNARDRLKKISKNNIYTTEHIEIKEN